MNRQPTVSIVDDDPSVCASINALMRSVKLPAETFASAKEFLDQFDSDRPGCLVLDLCMSGMSGLALQEELHSRGAILPIIFITAHGEVSCAVCAMKAGCQDFLEKPFRGHQLLDCINRALDLDSRQRAELAQRRDIARRFELLTQREREVLNLMVAGQSYKAIASRLGISYKTVEAHRTHIVKKLRVESTPELMSLVIAFSNRPRQG